MTERNPAPAFALLQRWGLLRAIHPCLRYQKRYAALLTQIATDYRIVVLCWDAPLAHLDEFITTWHELPVVYRQIPRIRRQKRQFRQLVLAPASTIARQLQRFNTELLGALAIIHQPLNVLLTRWATARQHASTILVNGNDVMALGIPAGPRIGVILSELTLALLDQTLDQPDRSGQLAWITRQFISQSH
jgi:tRNA nucleotidyltransferase/poly(A) polymerase